MARGVDVLILTTDLDFASDSICRKLTQRGIPFLRLNRDSLSDLGLVLDPVAPRLTCRLGSDEWEIDHSLRSVLWRLGTFDRNVAGSPLDLGVQLERSQWSAFMRSMMVFSNAKWINHPAATYAAETKAVQLRTARAVGFDVPETWMGNDPEALPAYQVGSRVAFKSIDTLLLRDGGEQLFAYTSILGIEDLATSDLRLAPATIQTALEPKLDLRVTVVGDQCWCAEVRGSGEPINGDWRLTPKTELSYPAHALPIEIERRCRKLVAELGLVFGAIDLALANDSYWFIEINPTGEWGWLDGPARPIADAIVGELACRS